MQPDVGIVVIGRNEGERLVEALASCAGRAARLVYADSGSTDGSVARARAAGASVIELDRTVRHTAARGRNAGLALLRSLAPELEYVFFMDGDCALDPGFLPAARAALERDPGLAAVCGRRRERFPGRSRYNALVDVEWDTPLGEASAFGGDVLARIDALERVGGYDEALFAGEDPELGWRLRCAGWRILRIADEMTLHDVALSSFGAWWRRHARGGEAYLLGAAKHLRAGGAGRPEERARYNARACASIAFWGLALPVSALAAALPTHGLSLLSLAALELALCARVRRARRRAGSDPRSARAYAAFVTLGKLAEAQGLLRGLVGLARGDSRAARDYAAHRRRDAA